MFNPFKNLRRKANQQNNVQQNNGQQNNGQPNNSEKDRGTRRNFIGPMLKSYGTSFLTVGVMMPVVASFITVALYLTLSNSPLPAFPGVQAGSSWHVLVWSSVLTVIFWLVIALPCTYFSTARSANPRNYSLLESRLHQLKASLGMKDFAKNSYEETTLDAVDEILKNAGTNEHKKSALREAYTCCIDISRKLYQSRVGLAWTIGTGYNSAWTLLHHAEEVMIEVADVQTVIRGAEHDFLAIEGSGIDESDSLLDSVLQAVEILDADSLVYFKEHQPGSSSVALRQIKQKLDTLGNASGSNTSGASSTNNTNSPGTPPANNANASTPSGAASSSTPGTPTGASAANTPNTKCPDANAQAIAKGMLREVRSTLNDYRDKRWEGLVRQRGRLMKAIVLAGIVTHALLCITLLSDPPALARQSFTPLQYGILSAAIFYMVGAIAGLFVRFSGESQGGTSVDDFGLSTIRLIATPVLSGLAGVLGVLVTETLASLGEPALLGSVTTKSLDLATLFTLDPRLLLTAAIFGVTPNLVIRGLQQKANEYENELQSTKAAQTSTK